MLFFVSVLYVNFHGGEDCEKYGLPESIFEGEKSIHAYVTGRVDSIEEKTNSKFIYLKDTAVSFDGRQEIYKTGKLLLIAGKDDSKVFTGNIVISGGNLCRCKEATNPAQFDERGYYRQKDIYYKMFSDDIKISDDRINLFKNLIFELKSRIKNVYGKFLSAGNAGIATAMFLGDKSQLDIDVRDLYQANGVGHLLAISGLHISIICMGIYRFLLSVHFPRKYIPLITMFFIVCYGFLSGYSVSAVRAVIMMSLFLFAEFVGRSYDILSAMGFSGIIVIFINPYLTVSTGFLLSYGAVFGIAVIAPAIRNAIIGGEKKQRAMGRMKSRQKKILLEAFSTYNFRECIPPLFWIAKKYFLECLIINLSVQISTLPVILYFFYEYPPYSIAINMVLLPFAPVLVGTLAIGGILGLFLDFPAVIFLKIGDILLYIYGSVCSFFSRLPFSVIITGRPSITIICVYILSIVIFLYMCYSCFGKRNKKNRAYSQKSAYIWNYFINKSARLCILPLSGCLLFFIPNVPNGLEIAFLDVGQGDGIVAFTAPRTGILIDGGSADVSEVGKYRIIPYLKYRGISKLEYMIVTHEDMDHISGQLELLEHGREEGIVIGMILLPKPAKISTGNNYQKLIKLAAKEKIPIEFIDKGDFLERGKIKFTCIHPKKGFVADSCNAYSTTLQVSYGSTVFLLTGDLEKNGEEEVLKNEALHKTDINLLKVAHHGSKNSTSREFLDIIKPELGIISCGEGNRYGHPHDELLERLNDVGCRYFTTAKNGALTVKSDGIKIEVKAFKE